MKRRKPKSDRREATILIRVTEEQKERCKEGRARPFGVGPVARLARSWLGGATVKHDLYDLYRADCLVWMREHEAESIHALARMPH
jgi:hypothetical protein